MGNKVIFDGLEFALNEIKEGDKIKYHGASDGVVKSLMGSPCTYMGTDNVAEVRLEVEHDDGAYSYHSYRYDGRSVHDANHDIVEIEHC